MLKSLSIVAAFAIALSGASVASVAPCKDAKGKFTKCPATAPAKPTKCKDAKGKFAKCGAPGTKPV